MNNIIIKTCKPQDRKKPKLPYSADQNTQQFHRTVQDVPRRHQLQVFWMFSSLCHALHSKKTIVKSIQIQRIHLAYTSNNIMHIETPAFNQVRYHSVTLSKWKSQAIKNRQAQLQPRRLLYTRVKNIILLWEFTGSSLLNIIMCSLLMHLPVQARSINGLEIQSLI